MGRRILAVSSPRRDLRDRELAQELAQAKDWEHVNELRGLADLSPAEAVALAMIVDPEAAMRLLDQYLGSR